jgi:hypothetical protein
MVKIQPYPSSDQVIARKVEAEKERANAISALTDALDAEIAAGKHETAAVIDARRRVANAEQSIDALDAALARARSREDEAAVLAREQENNVRYREALSMVPHFIELSVPVGFSRGSNREALATFVEYGLLILAKLPNAPAQAREHLQGDLAAQARKEPSSDPHLPANQARDFTDAAVRAVAWWFGISNEEAQKFRPRGE